jgi:hypothetical protein
MRLPDWTRVKAATAELRARIHERVLVYRTNDSGSAIPQVRVLEKAELRGLALPYSAETLADNWSNGWALYTYFEDSVPVSFAWVRLAPEHRITEIRARVRAPAEVGWIVHCITPEAFRGHGFYPQLIRNIARSLGETTYIYCTQANLGSRRGIEKAGFELAGTIARTLGRLANTVAGLSVLNDAGGAASR